jgi:SAM-dependent methyltransferase
VARPGEARRVPGRPASVPPVTEPALWGLRRRLLDLLDRLHLARPAVRLYELALAAKSGLDAQHRREAGNLPLPPARLRAQAGPRHADAGFFLRSGQRHAELIRELLRQSGSSIEELDALLDWGCGCGRVLRHWSHLPRTGVFGCDINPRMVDWCAANLGFAEVRVNDISPPLPYPDSSFDLVYALSVITHLPEDLQHAWIQECLRVLRPDGYLLISTLGEYYLSRKRLTESERQTFVDGNVVVLYDTSPGTSLCSAYHPPEYVHRNLAKDFELVVFRPAADDGRHDIHLLRKPAPALAATEQP